MVNLDNTILNVALPTLVRRLGATTGQLQWIVDAYAIVFGGTLLVAGSVADRLGRKRLFLTGLVVFGGGSLAAAFSGSVDSLILWRAVMGAGAAMTIPAGLSIVNDLFRDPVERAKAVGTWAGTVGLGIAVGPVAGGLLLSRFWWGSVFLVNVPVVAAGFVGTLTLVPESRSLNTRAPDPLGALLSMGGLGLVLWSIIEGPDRGWGSAEVLGTALAGLAVVAAFLAWEYRTDHPMLPLGYFRSRRFSVAAASLGFGVFALLGGLFIMTQFLQFSLGYSPLAAGVRVLPVSAVLAAGALASHRLVKWTGTKLTAAGALLLIVGGLAQVAAAGSVDATYLQELPGMLLMGLGAGLLLPACTDSVLGALSRDDAGVGSATNSTSMQVGGAVGVAVIGSVLSTRYQDHMHTVLAGRQIPAVAAHAILGSIGGALAVAKVAGGFLGAELTAAARDGFMAGNRTAMVVGACVTGAGALLVLAALPSRPQSAPGGPGLPLPPGREAPAPPTNAGRSG
jgi:EmrB/QacA subfamily drug resistance transporter